MCIAMQVAGHLAAARYIHKQILYLLVKGIPMQVSALLRVENSFNIATDMQMQAIDDQAVAMTLAA